MFFFCNLYSLIKLLNRNITEMYAENSKYVLEAMTSSDKGHDVIRRNFKDMITIYNTQTKTQTIYRVTRRDDKSDEKNSNHITIEKKFDDVSKKDSNDDVCREKSYYVASKEKIKEDVKSLDDVCDEKTQNLLLFHGTSLENSVGIIEEGFVPSKKGKFGPGVYLTASLKCAKDYAVRKSVEKKLFLPKNKSKTPMTMLNHEPQAHCVFVNEVLESEKLNVLKWNLGSTNDQFARYIEMGSVEDLQKYTYDGDSGGKEA